MGDHYLLSRPKGELPMRPSLWHPPLALSTAEHAIIKRIRRAKLFVFLRQHRHELFADPFQQELMTLYKDQPQGHPPVPPAQLALATIEIPLIGVRQQYPPVYRQRRSLRSWCSFRSPKAKRFCPTTSSAVVISTWSASPAGGERTASAMALPTSGAATTLPRHSNTSTRKPRRRRIVTPSSCVSIRLAGL
jgi:hypothetical protein